MVRIDTLSLSAQKTQANVTIKNKVVCVCLFVVQALNKNVPTNITISEFPVATFFGPHEKKSFRL